VTAPNDPEGGDVIEPENLTVVMIGNLADNNPWDLEFWARDDATAHPSTARWYRAGLGDDGPVHSMTWDRVLTHAENGLGEITVLGRAA
jgi:hypothetical protein